MKIYVSETLELDFSKCDFFEANMASPLYAVVSRIKDNLKDDQGARYKTLRTQMHALAACRLQMGFKGRTYNTHPVDQFDAWINDAGSGRGPRWPGTLRLSDNFYNILMDSPVPLDNRALSALSGSALALGTYIAGWPIACTGLRAAQ